MTDLSTHDHPATTIPRRNSVSILAWTRQCIGVLADIEHVIERLPNGRFNQDQWRLKYLAHLPSPQRRSARSEAAAKHAEPSSHSIFSL